MVKTPAHGARPRTERVLHADDPSEILALLGLELGAPVRDSLALVGCRERVAATIALRCDLPPAGASGPPPRAAEMLQVLARSGAREAVGMVVVGDGREAVGSGVAAAGVVAAARVLAVAAQGGPVDLPELWVAAAGRAIPVRWSPDIPGRREPDEERAVQLGDPVPLVPEDSTLVAAQRTFAGIPRPSPAAEDVVPRLRAQLAGPGRRDGARRLPRPPVVETWRSVLEVLDPRTPRGVAEVPGWDMTACERVRDLVLDLASVDRRDALLCHLVGRGRIEPAPPGGAQVRVLFDPECGPHPSVCAGGRHYEALRTVEAAARPTSPDATAWGSATLSEGWANAAAVLALLAWWNRRHATCGELVGAILRVHPDHSMARLIALMDHQATPPWAGGRDA